MEQEIDMYDVAVCQGIEFDWQMAIHFLFDSFEEAMRFVSLSLENDLIVQIVKNPDQRALR